MKKTEFRTKKKIASEKNREEALDEIQEFLREDARRKYEAELVNQLVRVQTQKNK